MKKRWIVVTGASSGIGCATAHYLIETGYSVVVTSRNVEILEKNFSKYKEDVKIICWDLSKLDSIKDYAKKVRDEIGEISGLVHCAGIQKMSPIHMVKLDKIIDVFNINTFSAMLLTSAFSKKNGYERNNTSIVLLSSISAHCGVDGNSIYASSKGALEGFVKGVSCELAEKGIRINAIAPGRVMTPMVENFIESLSDVELENAKMEYPLGWGEPENIAEIIEFLLSKKSKWITGQCIITDGGHTVRTSH